MTRRHIIFTCEGETLVGTLDAAAGAAGLLIVSGGNETRAGAQSNTAALAASVAEAGYPVFRFDRRGVGDATGENTGFRNSAPDIEAALCAFYEAVPGLQRIVGYGNCDAASGLMLEHGAGYDALVLANPWTFDREDALPPPEAIRARYAERLNNPRELARLLTGKVSLPKLASGLAQALRRAPPASSLAAEIGAGLAKFDGPARILIAGNDRTGRAFRASLPELGCEICEGAGHAFTEPFARAFLVRQLIGVLEEQTRQLDMR